MPENIMPPPKPSKKKSKSSKSTAKEASRLSNVGRDLDGQMFQLSREWETSSQRKALVQQIQDEIIPRENIVLENAICLGLGSLEKAAMGSLPGWSNTTSIIDRDEVLDKSLGPLLDDNLPRFRPVGKGQRRNFGLHQLLVFETVMTCLRTLFSYPILVCALILSRLIYQQERNLISA